MTRQEVRRQRKKNYKKKENERKGKAKQRKQEEDFAQARHEALLYRSQTINDFRPVAAEDDEETVVDWSYSDCLNEHLWFLLENSRQKRHSRVRSSSIGGAKHEGWWFGGGCPVELGMRARRPELLAAVKRAPTI